MPVLHVNIDHVATLREARKTFEPDPVYAAMQAEQAGAAGITLHLREDRRHIQERDLRLIRELVQTRLNLEMAATEEMLRIALQTKPDMVTYVPEKREEVTTEGGLDCLQRAKNLTKQIPLLKKAGILISLFIDPDFIQIDKASELGAEAIELHTGEYANASHSKTQLEQLNRLIEAAEYAHQKGLIINAGHGLNYYNVKQVAAIAHLKELNIGHSIMARSVFTGLQQAVRDMMALLGN